jgi:hypothetical protein
MSCPVLFLISSDPRASCRPAEAIRIAAGVGVWRKVAPALYLRGAAVLLLGDSAEALEDGENFVRYLPMLAERACPVYVEQDVPELRELGEPRIAFECVDDSRLAELTAASSSVLRF